MNLRAGDLVYCVDPSKSGGRLTLHETYTIEWVAGSFVGVVGLPAAYYYRRFEKWHTAKEPTRPRCPRAVFW